jgi:hypothetical protein
VTDSIDIERPACFYLGQEYDLAARAVRPDSPPVMYDARDLLTHGVVVGMTGSGKTGLCLTILEEAAIDGIPCVILDIKGDLTNLLLQFPDLNPEDFKPWLNAEDARTKKLTLDEFANQLSQRAKKGLADTLQTPDRIARLRDSSEWAIYTPGSDAGLPLAILKDFAAPPPGLPREEIAQKIDATVAALLGLTGISTDPVQSREHVFLAQLLLHAWNKGESIDLAQLINRVQVPPLRTIGAFDVDTFFPEKDRLKLALALNNLLASPSFATWIEGDPLNFAKLLESSGKPRQLIFYLAHLDDAQKMFFLTLLLTEVLAWTRKQSGTTGLRAILYFDEVFGYIPPYPANPPTKAPLMTLLKQARAFGVGVLLATQNPVDLDYKALSNAGTWMVGKLQTERDKARLIEGLEGVAAQHGTLSDRSYLETVISALGNRVFLLHNIHQPKPLLFQTRWALSFLRGPMTRDQVAELAGPLKSQRRGGAGVDKGQRARADDQVYKQQLVAAAKPGTAIAPVATSHVPPGLPPGLVPVYVPAKPPVAVAVVPGVLPPKRSLVYQARLLGVAEVLFADKKRGLEIPKSYRLLAEAPRADGVVNWATAQRLTVDIANDPAPNASWSEVPESLNSPKKLKALQKSLADFLYDGAKLSILENKELELRGSPGEDLQAFGARCRDLARQKAEAELAAARADYLAERQKLADLAPPPPPAANSMWDMPVLSWFKPGPQKVVLGPAPAKGSASKTAAKLQKLDLAWQSDQVKIIDGWKSAGEAFEEIVLSPRRTDIRVSQFTLAWVPYWRLCYPDGRLELHPAMA